MATGTNNLDFDCDWRRGFNFEPASTGTIGYLLFWAGCGGLALTKDIEVWNPFSGPGQTVVSGPLIKCVGLIESFRFDGEQDSPIRISAYVSKGTAANVRAKVAKPVTSTSVQVAYYILSYDDENKQWFEAAFVKNKAKASASVDTTGGVLQLFIDSQPTRVDDRLDLRVYKLEFQIAPPKGVTTELEFASGSTQKLVKSWVGE